MQLAIDGLIALVVVVSHLVNLTAYPETHRRP